MSSLLSRPNISLHKETAVEVEPPAFPRVRVHVDPTLRIPIPIRGVGSTGTPHFYLGWGNYFEVGRSNGRTAVLSTADTIVALSPPGVKSEK
jgi:hypothetical protein